MAGYREFQTGEVLTAANVNDFLGKQAVQKYADAAARDTALGTAVGGSNALREGMVAYLDDTDELLKYDGTAWASIGAAGIGSNVVQSVKTDTYSASVAAGAITGDITGLGATITPTSATSKILVIVSLTVGSVAPSAILYRDGSPVDYRGDAAGSRKRVATTSSGFDASGSNFLDGSGTISFSYLDSPATTSAVSYTVRCGHSDSATTTIYINNYLLDTDSNRFNRGASSIIAIEVEA